MYILYVNPEKYEALTPDQKAIDKMRSSMIHAATTLQESKYHEEFQWLVDKLHKDAYEHRIPNYIDKIGEE